jgi:hypothetical protein
MSFPSSFKRVLLWLAFAVPAGQCFAGQDDTVAIVRKHVSVTRVPVSPRIDGVLDDEVWAGAMVAGDFIQNSPVENAAVSFPTEVRILYDNNAIYVGAMLYDNSPDSIRRQLGLRDNYVNADAFRIVFDTYNTQQDAFDFSVTASGVQGDARFSDYNFNAVWNSSVKILPNGWSVEMEIPWSALRFPTSKIQTWGLQMTRNLQRRHEFDQWALTPKGKSNPLKYWGLLDGLNDIEAPVRLSLTPYLSTIWEKDSRFGETQPSMSVSGGLGLKYGLNESFTLDMTLLPDFSQVKSDNITKNLSPFEVQFSEQRPFFTEGTDLFQLGDVFYSRRIGRTPTYFYSAPYLIDSTEKITKNPSQSRLLNATKISGRTNSGLGIGLLNAYVDNTYATATDTVTGKTRKILTEPSSNYNIFVFDKQLQNGSNVFVTNTNVIRSHGGRSANVTVSGFSLNNKANTWNARAVGGVSDVLYPTGIPGEYDAVLGYYYTLGVGRTSGSIQYGLTRQVVNRNWDCNDMGINRETNYSSNSGWLGYYLFNPWKIFNYASVDLNINYSDNLETGRMNSLDLNLFSYANFRNYWSLYLGTSISPVDSRDYYEPRTEGRYYLRTRNKNFFGGFNSNSNYPFSFGGSFHLGSTSKITETIPANPWFGGGINLDWRLGNRFKISFFTNWHGDFGDRGYIDTETDGTIVFGRRNLRAFSNSLFASFVFVRDMSLSLSANHFWQTGEYIGYYVLREDGTLMDYVNYPGAGQYNFNFNSFNIDMVYRWIFAPGSILSIAWKQNILADEPVLNFDYFSNLNTTVRGPQLNQVSVSVLYYLDYNYVRNRFAKK